MVSRPGRESPLYDGSNTGACLPRCCPPVPVVIVNCVQNAFDVGMSLRINEGRSALGPTRWEYDQLITVESEYTSRAQTLQPWYAYV